MKTKKSIIDEYNCDIYNVILVVANRYTTLEELQKLYTYSDKVELDKDIINGDCTTSTCYRKSDGALVVLVKHNHYTTNKSLDKKLDFIDTCAHEATHVALDIYEFINQSICNCSPEPFCYLTGWATRCIYKTLTKK